MDNESRTSEQRDDTPLHQLLDSPSVTIVVGDDKTRWTLPERLVTHYSPVLASAFESSEDQASDERPSSRGSDSDKNKQSDSKKDRKSYTLSDEEDTTFELLVAYFYSRNIPPATSEKATGPLLDLYLLALKLQISNLTTAVVDAVREWYHTSGSYPGLRRVQYIYANTDEDNEMREMMISAVARQLTTCARIPAHWATALQRNGQLAVDIIRAIQQWHIEENSIPDARDGRSRKAKGGFSAIGREGDSVETDASGMVDSAIGLESLDGDREVHEKAKAKFDDTKQDAEGNMFQMKEVAATADNASSHANSPANLDGSKPGLYLYPRSDTDAVQIEMLDSCSAVHVSDYDNDGDDSASTASTIIYHPPSPRFSDTKAMSSTSSTQPSLTHSSNSESAFSVTGGGSDQGTSSAPPLLQRTSSSYSSSSSSSSSSIYAFNFGLKHDEFDNRGRPSEEAQQQGQDSKQRRRNSSIRKKKQDEKKNQKERTRKRKRKKAREATYAEQERRELEKSEEEGIQDQEPPSSSTDQVHNVDAPVTATAEPIKNEKENGGKEYDSIRTITINGNESNDNESDESTDSVEREKAVSPLSSSLEEPRSSTTYQEHRNQIRTSVEKQKQQPEPPQYTSPPLPVPPVTTTMAEPTDNKESEGKKEGDSTSMTVNENANETNTSTDSAEEKDPSTSEGLSTIAATDQKGHNQKRKQQQEGKKKLHHNQPQKGEEQEEKQETNPFQIPDSSSLPSRTKMTMKEEQKKGNSKTIRFAEPPTAPSPSSHLRHYTHKKEKEKEKANTVEQNKEVILLTFLWTGYLAWHMYTYYYHPL